MAESSVALPGAPAQFWEPHGTGARCLLCCHYCSIEPGRTGRCGVRQCVAAPAESTAKPDKQNSSAPQLRSLVMDRPISVALDPIEKKPLYHFMPGTRTLSFGTVGCNFSCDFCQNWSISRLPADTGQIRGQVVSAAQMAESAVQEGAASISFTYTEPAVFYEYMVAVADEAARRGLARVMVSNGFFSPRALHKLGPRIQAANIDLKAFSESFYRDICGGRLKPVLDNLVSMLRLGWWLEITTLLIPGLNDSEQELRALARFIKENLGDSVPWHISRFRPEYRLTNRPPTPMESLERAHAIGRAEGLKFVYLGNVPHAANSTWCPDCGALFARRQGFGLEMPGRAACAACGCSIPGVGWPGQDRTGQGG